MMPLKQDLIPYESVDFTQEDGIFLYIAGLGVLFFSAIIFCILIKSDKIAIASIIPVFLISISLVIMGMSQMNTYSDGLEKESEALTNSSSENLKSTLKDKYEVSLRSEAIEIIKEDKKINAYIKDGLVNGTSSDGKNMQLSFEVTGPGELIAYSSGIELPTLKDVEK